MALSIAPCWIAALLALETMTGAGIGASALADRDARPELRAGDMGAGSAWSAFLETAPRDAELESPDAPEDDEPDEPTDACRSSAPRHMEGFLLTRPGEVVPRVSGRAGGKSARPALDHSDIRLPRPCQLRF